MAIHDWLGGLPASSDNEHIDFMGGLPNIRFLPLGVVGWAHKVYGVPSPGKVLGVPNASIAKVMGVPI